MASASRRAASAARASARARSRLAASSAPFGLGDRRLVDLGGAGRARSAPPAVGPEVRALLDRVRESARPALATAGATAATSANGNSRNFGCWRANWM